VEEIRLWAMCKSGDRPTVKPVESIKELDYEQSLEDVLTEHPDLLFVGLNLVGRQTPTSTGWLDLLGVDEDGRLVVFELKRGTLARDAVAQIIDYASYLNNLDEKALSHHIAERSGKDGIEDIADFQGWYEQTYPGKSINAALPPRMVLVGLGADETTEHMVRFLSESGVDISLVTFHAFRHGDQPLIAKQVKIHGPTGPRESVGRLSKASIERIFQDLASTLSVSRHIQEMRAFLKERLPSPYEYPGKESVGFYNLERAESGNPSYRAYVSLYIYPRSPGIVGIGFHNRAVELAPNEFAALTNKFNGQKTNWSLNFRLTSDQQWPQFKEELGPLLDLVAAEWPSKR